MHEEFWLSRDDTQDKNEWRLRIKRATGLPRFTWKMDIKMECVCEIDFAVCYLTL